MQNKIISADTQVDLGFLPWDLFTSQSPKRWKNQMPHVIEKNGRAQWWVDGKFIQDVALYPELSDLGPEMKYRVERIASTGLLEDVKNGVYRPIDPELRLKDQDLDGVFANVIYGLTFMSAVIEDREKVAACYKIYNDWIANFCKNIVEFIKNSMLSSLAR